MFGINPNESFSVFHVCITYIYLIKFSRFSGRALIFGHVRQISIIIKSRFLLPSAQIDPLGFCFFSGDGSAI